ncbi:oligosaccharide flippase family protein [Altererythrobacter aquaemixtae]|uniref:Oligosaccharide flippase family protein n=1 Tax=Pontixanthobacter aquaemixtae TaxID=1958940 RepID=A0A844ZRB5_9SPHN|nr:oligosaccharide flippase family protein [Pontixanthobacter aquaemixtae]
MAWRWGTQVFAQLITWASTFAVIRILTPADYGLFAMTQAVLTALAFLNGYSFATSLIQAKEIDDRRVGQVFGMLIVAGVGLAIVQSLFAPVAAAYYGQPMVEDMLRVQAVIFLATPFIALPSALLARRIEFRNQGLVNLLCAVVGASTALILALGGSGVWALVFAPIAMAAARAIGLTISAKLLVKPVFDFRGAWDIVSFGGALTLCQFLWIVQSQSDVLIAGPAFSPGDLGIYTTSLFLVLIITGKFIPPINEVLFPALSELAKTGRPLAPFFIRTLRTVALVTAPLYIGLALTAEATVLTIAGDKWADMIPIIAGLTLAMPFFALQIVCSPATNAIGKPRIYVATSTAGAILFPAAFLIGVSSGPMGLVHAWWFTAPALLAITLALTLPAIEVRIGDLLKQLFPVAVACALMAAVVTAVKSVLPEMAAPFELAILAATGGVTYGAALWMLWPHILTETWAMLRSRKANPADVVTPA